jgi:hypothetical protein
MAIKKNKKMSQGHAEPKSARSDVQLWVLLSQFLVLKK